MKLAAQTFSSSVSKTLVFASELRLLEFAGCSGTAQFIAAIDRAFDLSNSRCPVASGYKAPLLPATLQCQKAAMESVGQEPMELQLATGKPGVPDGRRTLVISLAFTLKSTSQLAVVVFGSNLCR